MAPLFSGLSKKVVASESRELILHSEISDASLDDVFVECPSWVVSAPSQGGLGGMEAKPVSVDPGSEETLLRGPEDEDEL